MEKITHPIITKSSNKSILLNADKDKVFAFLSDIRNITKWATEFAKELKKEGEHYKVVNAQGELYFRMQMQESSGVIDFYAGPTLDQMAYFPSRVIGISPNQSYYVFTSFQLPGMSDEQFKAQCDSLDMEFVHIKAYVEKGRQG